MRGHAHRVGEPGLGGWQTAGAWTGPRCSPGGCSGSSSPSARRRRRRSGWSPASRASMPRSWARRTPRCAPASTASRTTSCPRALWRDGTLVKTWAMRGTLHLLVRDELPDATSARCRACARATTSPPGSAPTAFTREQADAMLAAIPEVLARKPLTRAELAAAVARKAKEPVLEEKLADGFGALLKPAAFAGDLVFAEGEGQKVRFTTPDVTPEDGEEAAQPHRPHLPGRLRPGAAGAVPALVRHAVARRGRPLAAGARGRGRGGRAGLDARRRRRGGRRR